MWLGESPNPINCSIASTQPRSARVIAPMKAALSRTYAKTPPATQKLAERSPRLGSLSIREDAESMMDGLSEVGARFDPDGSTFAR